MPTAPPENRWSGVSWVYGGTLTFYAAGALFYLILAHVLNTTDLGSVVVLLAISTIASTGAVLGLNTGFQHFLSYRLGREDGSDPRRIVRLALLAALGLGLLAAGAVAGLAPELSSFLFHSSAFARPVELVGVYAGLLAGASILQSVLLGLQRFVTYSVVFTTASLSVFGCALLLYVLSPGLGAIEVGWILGGCVGVVAALVGVLHSTRALGTRPVPPRPSAVGPEFVRALMIYSIPVLASSLIGAAAAYVDRLVLASLVSLATVGVYNYAILIASGSLFLVMPFAAILVPRFSEHFAREEWAAIRRISRTATSLSVLVYVPVGLALAALGPVILREVFGAEYVAAALPLSLLLVITGLAVPYTVLISLASGIRRTTTLLHASALALTANVALSVLLVPRLGMVGAALGNSAMYWVSLAVLYLELRSSHLLSFDTRAIVRIWASSGAMLVVMAVPLALLGYDPIWAPIALLAGLATLLAALRLTRAIPPDVTLALNRGTPRWASFCLPVVRWVSAPAIDPAKDSSGSSGPLPISLRK